MIYTAIIGQILTCDTVVWCPKINQTTTKIKLNQILRTTYLLITEAMKTIQTKAMEVLLPLITLNIYIKEVALMTIL